MSTNSRRFYGFGPFRVDESERLLLRGEDVVPLTPKAFEMLLVLLESSGRVLTKEELMKRVWALDVYAPVLTIATVGTIWLLWPYESREHRRTQRSSELLFE